MAVELSINARIVWDNCSDAEAINRKNRTLSGGSMKKKKYSKECKRWRSIKNNLHKIGKALGMAIHTTSRVGFLATWLVLFLPHVCSAQSTDDLIKTLEPGIGYSKFKQWASDNKLVFESFTKDQLTVRDTGAREGYSLRIFAKFCGGDDYSGRGSAITVQQAYSNPLDALQAWRDGVELLGGPSVDGRYPGQYIVRRDRPDVSPPSAGLAISQESDKGSWELGLFAVRRDAFLLQIVRRKESICE